MNKIIARLLVLGCLVCFLGCMKSERGIQENDNAYFAKKYELEESPLVLHKLTLKDIQSLEYENCLLLFIRYDCEHCHTLMDLIANIANKQKICEDLYVFETDELTNEEKQIITDLYNVTVVPTFVGIKGRKQVLSEISIPSEERIKELIGGKWK